MKGGAPYEGKLSRTVQGRGKSGDNIKGLPIAIHCNRQSRRTGRTECPAGPLCQHYTGYRRGYTQTPGYRHRGHHEQ